MASRNTRWRVETPSKYSELLGLRMPLIHVTSPSGGELLASPLAPCVKSTERSVRASSVSDRGRVAAPRRRAARRGRDESFIPKAPRPYDCRAHVFTEAIETSLPGWRGLPAPPRLGGAGSPTGAARPGGC